MFRDKLQLFLFFLVRGLISHLIGWDTMHFPQMISRVNASNFKYVIELSQYKQASHPSEATGTKIRNNAIFVMRDHKRTQNMNNCSPRRRSNHDSYDKDMDHAFTLIFHNIKRLQDGHLCNSDPNLVQANDERDVKPTTMPKVPVRKRSRSEPFLAFAEGEVQRLKEASSIQRSNSQPVHGEGNLLQRRRVRFADDCGVKEHPKGLSIPLSKR